MRAAVLDLGTNTFHLLAVEKNASGTHVLVRRQLAVKLGEGGIGKNYIADAAFERGIKAIHRLHSDVRKIGPDRVRIIATSAIRNASNGKEFIRQVKRDTGWTIEIIDGLQEASYIFKGVNTHLGFLKGRYLVMDIGGGSVEFILAEDGEKIWSHSFEVGCARLIEKYHREDPIPQEDITALEAYLAEQLAPLIEAAANAETLIGAAGSFESVVQLVEQLRNEECERLNEGTRRIRRSDFDDIYKQLLGSTYAQRSKMKGLEEFRIEMMVVAVILIRFVLDKIGIKELYCSTSSLKEGVLMEMLDSE